MSIFKKNNKIEKENDEMINEVNKNTPSVKMERVDINVLHTHLYFQNDPNPTRVSQIVENFDWNLLQPLDVSFRDGKYNVIDGQNRLYATLEKFKDSNKTITVPCLVRYGLSESDEMTLFVNLAQLRRKVKPIEIYQALYGAKNKFIVDMVDTIRNVGFVFDFKDTKSAGRITAVKTIHTIYGELGNNDFEKYLRLIYLTWNGDSRSLQQDMLKGMFEFYKCFVVNIDEKTFVKRLGKLTAEEIGRLGGRNVNRVNGIAYSIMEQYNKGAKKNRLEERMF